MAKLEGVARGGSASASNDSSLRSLRSTLVSGATCVLLAGLMTSTEAAPRRFYVTNSGWFGGSIFMQPRFVSPSYRVKKRNIRSGAAAKRHKPETTTGFGETPKGPLQIVVSTGTQRVTLFSNGVRVAQGPVSTGTASNPTPLGVFSIIEKDRHHRSNLYGNAPMPYMQRLTWSGVALHEGVLPGVPASHGCIRLSRDFAAKLWPTTRLGARVIVARNELAPVDFAHSKLFGPKQKPGEPPVAMHSPSDGMSRSRPVKLAQAAAADAEASATDGPPDLRRSVEIPLPNEQSNPAEPAAAAGAMLPAAATAQDSDPVKPAPTIDPAKPMGPRTRLGEQPLKRTGQVAVFVSRKEKRIFVRQGFIPVLDLPVVIDEPDQPLGTHVFTAMGMSDRTDMRWNLFTIPTDGSLGEPHPRRREPPVPAVRQKAPSTAAEALDRIQMPKEAVDRISEILVPGSSLVISDQGLGKETGRATEFIVLTR